MQKGFTFIEVLISAFVLATVAVAITGLGFLVTKQAIRSEQKTVLLQLLNEKLEIARSYSYAEVDYTKFPPGKILENEIVTRNGVPYRLKGVVTLIDDKANGLLAPGTPLNKDTADFTQLAYVGQAADFPSSTSTVVASTFFAKQTEPDVCVPRTITCLPRLEDRCVPGVPASCPDQSGSFTLDCPATGVCAGKEPFLTCPQSGKCSDASEDNDQNPNPGPGQNGGGSPAQCVSDLNCPSGSTCQSGFCQPQWCQQAGLVNSTAEVCSLEGCDDGIDNDNDGGIDATGVIWDVATDQCKGPGCVPPDDQCLQLASQGGIYEPAGECIRNNPNSNDCSGLQRYRKIGSLTPDQCTSGQYCGTERYEYRACVVPGCQAEGDRCQVRHGCPNNSSCSPPGPLEKPVCNRGNFFECTAANKTNCPVVVGIDPKRGPGWCDDNRSLKRCACVKGRCVQCEAIFAKDGEYCRQKDKTFCALGRCVECLRDSDCPLQQNCRNVPGDPPDVRYTCQPFDKDGRDNDEDGLIDEPGEVNKPIPRPFEVANPTNTPPGSLPPGAPVPPPPP